MIRRDQLMGAVIRQPALNIFAPVRRASGKLVWPVHPVDAGVDVMLIAGSDL